jgi:thioredoxin reductase (NADPH)
MFTMTTTTKEQDERFYRDTESIAFPNLDDHQLALLESLGSRKKIRKGEIVIKAGERDFPMVLVIDGMLEAYEPHDGEEQILANAGPRSFLGDVSMLTGTSSIASVRGQAEESEVLLIPASEIQYALAEYPEVGKPIVQAFIMRRERLLRDPEFIGLRIIANAGCRTGHRMDDFLDKNHIPHRLMDSASPESLATREKLNITEDALPVLIANDGTVFSQPTVFEIARVAGLLRPLACEEDKELFCDLAIVGAGPAGLASAVNAASEGLKTVVLESFAPGGQAGMSSLIENFFGFPTGISGGELTNRAQLQAHRFGAKFSTPSQVLSLAHSDGEYGSALTIDGTNTILRAKTVIISSGARYNLIEAEGRERFEGMGVFYAATSMEGKYCRGSTVVVAGAGNSAGQAAMFLSEIGKKVILVVRGDDLGKSMSSYLSNRVEAKENIEILYHTEIRRMMGKTRLEEVEIENTSTGERRVIQTVAVFSMIGARPCTDWLPSCVLLDNRGFVKTGTSVADSPKWAGMNRPPYPFETSCPGIFAAGDVRSGSVKRCGAAVGEGSMAIENVHQMLGTYS